MSSYFILTLDTTPPALTIEAPVNTYYGMDTDITIYANETLAPNYTLYIIDSNGDRHDLTFDHQGSTLVGHVNLDSYPLGLLTVYAQVWDEVHNMSTLTSKTINNTLDIVYYNYDVIINTMKIYTLAVNTATAKDVLIEPSKSFRPVMDI